MDGFCFEKPIKMDDLGVPPHLWKPPFSLIFFFAQIVAAVPGEFTTMAGKVTREARMVRTC